MWFTDGQTGVYRDNVKWAYWLVEADPEMYRATHDKPFLLRAITNADFQYAAWKQKPPEALITNAPIARVLWLSVDTQSDVGRKFWDKMDRP